jgi:predicted TIM-barrel fold metal-dependent hydrolase
MLALLRRHPKTTIIWAHTGLGRVVVPVKHHAAVLAAILAKPEFKHVYFDISWDQTARYILANPVSQAISADLINRYPDRFLFGTDEVAPASESDYLRVFKLYAPLWSLLTPSTGEKVRKTNYERIFDEARHRVRTWESSHAEAGRGR